MESECIEWWGYIRPDGYGEVHRHDPAHRMVWEECFGPIPADRELDHLCRNPGCVNPEHMEIVTSRENTLRGFGATAIHARKTRCPQGHPYSAENTYRPPAGGRKCRICCRAGCRRYHRRRYG